MRWPIRFQLLLPTLSVVVLAIALATGVSVYFGTERVRQAQEESLRRAVVTLSEAKFPLNEPILQQMRGLSGAEFVFFDRQENVKASTLTLSDMELVRLLSVPIEPSGSRSATDLATSPTVMLGNRLYLAQRVAVAPHEPLSPAGSLAILYPKDLWWSAVRQAAYPAIISGALAVFAVVVVATVLAYRFVQPIHRLKQRAAAIAQGDFQPVDIARRNDEIRDLAISINQMAEQLGQYEQQIRRNEQLRTLGQLGAGLAHQLRNAATGGRMAIELHQRECAHGSESETLAVALRQLHLMESYLQRFLAIGRTQPLAHETVSLNAVVQGAVSLVQPTCDHAGVALVYHEPAAPFWIHGDPDALRQLVLNLALNAVEAAQDIVSAPVAADKTPAAEDSSASAAAPPQSAAPRIVIRLERCDGDRVALHVCDSGPGPAADVAARLFEPFVTGRTQGTGLGLYVARQVVEAHQGTLDWQRCNAETCFTAVFPLAAPP